MSDPKSPDPDARPDAPTHRPLERFWPYAELPEEPTEDELAKIHPEIAAVVFGAPSLPFSMSLVFPAFAGEGYERAVALARASDEYVETRVDGQLRHRARFFPRDRPERLRELYQLVAAVPDTDVLVDDQPVPYARELWLPLVWCLIR